MESKGVKRWPAKWHVSEVAAGFEFVVKGQSQCHPLANLFQEFYNQLITRSTFNLNCRWWNEKVPQSIKDHFIAYGKVKRALWPWFVKAVKSGVEMSSSSGGDDDEDTGHSTAGSQTDLELDLAPYGLKDVAKSHSACPDMGLSSSALCAFCNESLPVILTPDLWAILQELMLPLTAFRTLLMRIQMAENISVGLCVACIFDRSFAVEMPVQWQHKQLSNKEHGRLMCPLMIHSSSSVQG